MLCAVSPERNAAHPNKTLNALLALSVYTTLSCGQLALSSAGFMAIGAYAAALLTMNAKAPFPVALFASAPLARRSGP